MIKCRGHAGKVELVDSVDLGAVTSVKVLFRYRRNKWIRDLV